MRDDLLHYYERELTYLRRMGAEFARQYPKVASRLQLEATKCEDPHVERLLEGFAFLAARVHLKVDDEIPEISESLLQVVYPHYVRPIPSFSLVQFHPDPDQGGMSTGHEIPRGTALYSRPVGGVPCRFRTCYDTTLWPIRVDDAAWKAPHQIDPPLRVRDARAVLRLDLETTGGTRFDELEVDRLRLHIRAESGTASALLELILNECTAILVRDPDAPAGTDPVVLDPRDALRPVGFAEDESLLPPPRRTLGAYGLLLDYFTFPEKFLFFDLAGLSRLRSQEFGEKAEVLFCIGDFEHPIREDRLVDGISADTFRTGCTPIVNLFQKTSEPILLDQRRQEYPIVADARRRDTTGVYSVDEVSAVSPGSREPIPLRPFYSLDHGGADRHEAIYWQVKRRDGNWNPDGGTSVNLSFVDLSAKLVYPEQDSVTARLTCFNQDLPSRLPFGDQGQGDFELPGGGAAQKIVALTKPTAPIHPALGKAQLWRLISQLSLNYTSLVDGGGEGLRELLQLHNFADSLSVDRQIHGIRSIHAEPCHSRIESPQGLAFARGHRVEVEFDEEEFAGSGVYLFASVLERFLGRFVSLNSFSVLEARSRQRKQRIREWAPRSGSKALL